MMGLLTGMWNKEERGYVFNLIRKTIMSSVAIHMLNTLIDSLGTMWHSVFKTHEVPLIVLSYTSLES